MITLKNPFQSLLSLGITTVLLAATVLLPGCQRYPESVGPDALQFIKERGYLLVGTTHNAPPHGFLDEYGQEQGYDIEIARRIAKEIFGDAKKIKMYDMSGPSKFSAVRTRQVDFYIGAFTATEEREKFFDFSRPYFVSHFRILVKENSKINSLQDFAGKRLCFYFGGTSERILKENMPPSTQLIGFNRVSDEFRAFEEGMIDGIANQEGTLLNYAKDKCGLKLLPEVLENAPYVIVFQKSNKTQSLQKLVDTLLIKLEKDGELKALTQKWINPEVVRTCPN